MNTEGGRQTAEADIHGSCSVSGNVSGIVWRNTPLVRFGTGDGRDGICPGLSCTGNIGPGKRSGSRDCRAYLDGTVVGTSAGISCKEGNMIVPDTVTLRGS